jgi:uncharacterized membrane protein YfcA
MLSFIQIISIVVIGVVSGIIGSVTGAGSNIILPGILLSGITRDYKTALGTTLVSILPPLSIGAAYYYWKAGYVKMDVSILLIITIFISTTLFANYSAKYISNKALTLVFAIYSFLTGIYFLYRYFYE